MLLSPLPSSHYSFCIFFSFFSSSFSFYSSFQFLTIFLFCKYFLFFFLIYYLNFFPSSSFFHLFLIPLFLLKIYSFFPVITYLFLLLSYYLFNILMLPSPYQTNHEACTHFPLMYPFGESGMTSVCSNLTISFAFLHYSNDGF